MASIRSFYFIHKQRAWISAQPTSVTWKLMGRHTGGKEDFLTPESQATCRMPQDGATCSQCSKEKRKVKIIKITEISGLTGNQVEMLPRSEHSVTVRDWPGDFAEGKTFQLSFGEGIGNSQVNVVRMALRACTNMKNRVNTTRKQAGAREWHLYAGLRTMEFIPWATEKHARVLRTPL